MVTEKFKHLILQLALFISILLVPVFSFADTPTQVNFFATKSSAGDKNMVTMTTDLFFTKLQALSGYTVVDKRDTPYSEDSVDSETIAFYAEIKENADGSWECTLNAIKQAENKAISETRNYDSYYKILLDAKSAVENIMGNLSGDIKVPSSSTQNVATASMNLDTLAGTWKGEDLVDKIIIMRGGRGFVIFKNGASMTVSISLNGKNVSVTQNGRSNASYYPDLPRELALKNAANASPITWELTMVGNNTLKGTKTTLVEDSSTENGTKSGTFAVEWTKQ